MKNKKRNSKGKKGHVWKDSVCSLKESRNFIYVIIGLFIFGSLVGFFWPNEILYIEELLKTITGQIENLGMEV